MGIPSLRFSRLTPKSLCSLLPSADRQSWCPWKTVLSWEAGIGKAGLSGWENWPVRGFEKFRIPLAGLQLLLGIARQKCEVRFIQGGECKASPSAWEPLVHTTSRNVEVGVVCVCVPFPKADGKRRFSPHFFEIIFSSSFSSM